MRISDRSSDVCSSDLVHRAGHVAGDAVDRFGIAAEALAAACVDQRAALLKVRLHLRCVEQALFVEALRARDARAFAHAGLGGQAQAGPVLPAAGAPRGAPAPQPAQPKPQPPGTGTVRT